MIVLHRSPLCSMGAYVRTCQCLSVSLFFFNSMRFRIGGSLLSMSQQLAMQTTPLLVVIVSLRLFALCSRGGHFSLRKGFLRTHKSSCVRPNSSFILLLLLLLTVCLSFLLQDSPWRDSVKSHRTWIQTVVRLLWSERVLRLHKSGKQTGFSLYK